MPIQKIVRNQKVDNQKLELAKEFRKSMTPAERILWDRIKGNRLNGLHFRRQQVIEGFIVDFYCHAADLVVEVDGSVHDHTIERDHARDDVLKELGLRILRIKNEEVQQNIEAVLQKIIETINPDLNLSDTP